MPSGKRSNQFEASGGGRRPTFTHKKTAILYAGGKSEDLVNIGMDVYLPKNNSNRRRYRLDHGKLPNAGSYCGIPNHCHTLYIRRNLLEQLRPFSAQTVLELHKTCRIAPGFREAFDKTRADWIGHDCKHDRYG